MVVAARKSLALKWVEKDVICCDVCYPRSYHRILCVPVTERWLVVVGRRPALVQTAGGRSPFTGTFILDRTNFQIWLRERSRSCHGRLAIYIFSIYSVHITTRNHTGGYWCILPSS
jgi:hypothetical protein